MGDQSSSIALASALSVASVAGSISIFNLLVNKDQKISEYRQQWLEDVRTNVASVITQAHLLFARLHLVYGPPHAPLGSVDDQRNRLANHLNATSGIYDEINRAKTNLELRLNRTKPTHLAVLTSMEALEELLADVDKFQVQIRDLGYDAMQARVNSAGEKLVETAGVLIKDTWEKVKEGEPTYRTGKWLVVVLTAAVIGFLVKFYLK